VMDGVRRRVEEGRESLRWCSGSEWYLEEAGDDGNRARTPQQRDSGSSWRDSETQSRLVTRQRSCAALFSSIRLSCMMPPSKRLNTDAWPWQFQPCMGTYTVHCLLLPVSGQRHDDTHHCECFTHVSVKAAPARLTQIALEARVEPWRDAMRYKAGLSQTGTTPMKYPVLSIGCCPRVKVRYSTWVHRTPPTTSDLFQTSPESSTGQPGPPAMLPLRVCQKPYQYCIVVFQESGLHVIQ
jgi:hypothetical protein